MGQILTAFGNAFAASAALALPAAFLWGVLSVVLSPCHLSSIPFSDLCILDTPGVHASPAEENPVVPQDRLQHLLLDVVAVRSRLSRTCIRTSRKDGGVGGPGEDLVAALRKETLPMTIVSQSRFSEKHGPTPSPHQRFVVAPTTPPPGVREVWAGPTIAPTALVCWILAGQKSP
jgi:hypothetical protein